MIKLKDTEPLAKGRNRLVFQHPDNYDSLIKVVRDEFIERRFGPNAKWSKKHRRCRQFVSYVREIQEYLVTRAHSEQASEFFQKIEGFAETDLGLGLVIKAVRDPGGDLAPPLALLISSGRFNAQLKEDLDCILNEILESHIVVSDLNLGNFVHNGKHFVLIDGFGNSNPIPFKSLCKWLNRRSKLGRFKRLKKRIERCKQQYNIQD